MRDIEDFLPEIVAFTVDFFSSLFISACMSSSGSLYIPAMFIAVDLVHVMLEFWEVRMNSRVVLKLFQDRRASKDRLPNRTASDLEKNELLALMITEAHNLSECVRGRTLKGARHWASLPHPLTKHQREQLRSMEASGVFESEINSSETKHVKHRT
ncbi:unnamed protein product [Phytophthora lilii]|uniref:Unnamed protein product n=1 Tax=Phytophthora lilii TaxID=2077276 RepID=A0A9W6UE31_9STRA|nr:unnamed protein product [Phytophthora lilii]